MAAVPKTRYIDGSVQATQRTTQVTPSLHLLFCHFCYPHKAISSNITIKIRYMFYSKKKDVGMGLLV